MVKDETQARRRITLVCTGKTDLTDGKPGLVFHKVNADGTAGDERIYQHKGLEHLRVGAVYEVEIDHQNPRSVYTRTFKWVRLWDNVEEAAVWQLAAEAFDTAHLAVRQEKKENARRLPLELLAPIREEYWRTNPAGRLAIEVRVLAYLKQAKIG